MEQRRLRLGDILDDYCPRERRVTNHVVVAMIEDEIKQTRCSTCDAEHPYKGGKAPRRKKAESVVVPPPTTVVTRPPDVESEPESDQPTVPASEPAPPVHADAMPAPSLDEASLEEGPVHRPLIRATLPRPEGIKTERPPPEFTIRQNGTRGNGNFRGGFAAKGRGGHGAGGRAGNGGGGRFSRGGPQQGGRGQGRGGPSAGGFGRGPKKRSR
jgi:uncharacterized membrane protein YgcG